MNLRNAVQAASFSLLAFGFATAASANINLVTTNDFFSANAGPSDSGTYYWDHTSYDGTTCNIGYFLNNGSAGCGSVGNSNFVPGSSTNLDFLAGSANGGTVANPFTFTGSGAASTLLVTITGNANESIGYFDTSAHVLASKASGNVSTTISPVGSFYFYITTPTATYTTASNPNQFALFAPGVTTGSAAGTTQLDTFYLGAEDTAIGTGDNDYNDIVIKVTSAATPEPGFYGVLAAGLSGLVVVLKRRRKASQQVV